MACDGATTASNIALTHRTVFGSTPIKTQGLISLFAGQTSAGQREAEILDDPAALRLAVASMAIVLEPMAHQWLTVTAFPRDPSA
jgi:hypothetical protein